MNRYPVLSFLALTSVLVVAGNLLLVLILPTSSDVITYTYH